MRTLRSFVLAAALAADEVAFGAGGQLAMLKGERMLEIAFLTSSTDIMGAIRLAEPALRRLDED